jgi:hypothetical protein
MNSGCDHNHQPTEPDEVAAITAALQGFVPVLEDADPRQRAYIYTEDGDVRHAWCCVQDEGHVRLRFLMALRSLPPSP